MARNYESSNLTLTAGPLRILLRPSVEILCHILMCVNWNVDMTLNGRSIEANWWALAFWYTKNIQHLINGYLIVFILFLLKGEYMPVKITNFDSKQTSLLDFYSFLHSQDPQYWFNENLVPGLIIYFLGKNRWYFKCHRINNFEI